MVHLERILAGFGVRLWPVKLRVDEYPTHLFEYPDLRLVLGQSSGRQGVIRTK